MILNANIDGMYTALAIRFYLQSSIATTSRLFGAGTDLEEIGEWITTMIPPPDEHQSFL